MKDYPSVDGRVVHEIVINRSRFIATVLGVNSYDEAAEFVAEIKKQNLQATHNCYAFVSNETGTEQRFSDDGEPQGTAGQPMLEVLKKRGLCCTAVVVTRYFGGVKLGAGGLVSAYTRCVAEALDKAKIVLNRYSTTYLLELNYNLYNALQQALKGCIYLTLNAEFDANVKLTIAVPCEDAPVFLDKINDTLLGQATVSEQNSGYYKYSEI